MATAASEEWTKAVSQITAKAWSDAGFKKRLLSDPVTVLKDYGLTFPPGVTIKVLEDTDTVYHLSLPPKPTDEELSEEDLAAVAGGVMAAPTCRRCVRTGL
jgi:hypothetical protein